MRKPIAYSLMNLKTREHYSSNPGDYWNLEPNDNLHAALVAYYPVSGKNVIGGHKLVLIKREARKKDLEKVI
jgi:hypothetical protein